jgi:hypothetical protein
MSSPKGTGIDCAENSLQRAKVSQHYSFRATYYCVRPMTGTSGPRKNMGAGSESSVGSPRNHPLVPVRACTGMCR